MRIADRSRRESTDAREKSFSLFSPHRWAIVWGRRLVDCVRADPASSDDRGAAKWVARVSRAWSNGGVEYLSRLSSFRPASLPLMSDSESKLSPPSSIVKPEVPYPFLNQTTLSHLHRFVDRDIPKDGISTTFP